MKAPVRVEFFGLLPTLFAHCEHCMEVMHGTGMQPYSEQLEEYPEDVKKQYWELSSMANGLKVEFGDAVFVDAIDAASPRGVWTSIRLRIAKTPCILVQGKKAFEGIPDYQALRDRVRSAVTEVVRA
jgi:uncharacterized protein YbaA (DUF1428 family)